MVAGHARVEQRDCTLASAPLEEPLRCLRPLHCAAAASTIQPRVHLWPAGRGHVRAAQRDRTVAAYARCTVHTATKCSTAATSTMTWNTSWYPKKLGRGFGQRFAYTPAPAM